MAGILQIHIRQLCLRYAPSLPVLVLVLLLAAQLAHWTWVFFLPSKEIAGLGLAQTDAETAARSINAAHLFGLSTQTAVAVSNDRSSLNIRLTGVFAANGRTASYAIVNTGTKTDQTVRVGDEIQPGVRLKAVHTLYITVNHAGVPERINL